MSHLQRIYREASRRSVPIEVMLELTHRCNFRCQHCYIPDFDAPDLLPTERVLTLLGELAEMGTLVLGLSGGEVMLRRDWQAIAQRARDLTFDVNLFTNGWAIGEQQAAALASLECTVHVSYYPTDAASFDAITRRPGSFERVRAGVQRLRAHGARVILKMPLMTLNYRQSDEVRGYAESIGAECQVSPLINARKDGDLAPLRLRVPQGELYAQIGGPVLGCHPKDLDGPLCAAAASYCCITSSGDVTACNILPGSDGNVRQRAFRDVWESSPWLRQIRGIRATDLSTCNTCSRISYCGRCPAQALAEDGNLYGPSSYAQLRADLIDAAGAEAQGAPSATDSALAAGASMG